MIRNIFLFLCACFISSLGVAELSEQKRDHFNGLLTNDEGYHRAEMVHKHEIGEEGSVGDSPRVKRQLVGGNTEKDPNDPKYMKLAVESMNKYLHNSGNSVPHTVINVERVTYQLVAGDLTTIYFKVKPEEGTGDVLKCVSKLWEQSWTDKRDLDVTCHIDEDLQRPKRQLDGGVEERNPNDPQYMALAIESMNKYLHSSGNSAPHKVVRIHRVTYQLVAGDLTTIYFDVKPEEATGAILSCVSKLWEQSWTHKRDINVTCHIDDNSQRPKIPLTGGAQERDPNDPQYMQLAIESMNKYLQSSGNSAPHKVVHIERVTSQVVAGDLTTVYFKVKSEEGTGDVLSCVSKLWVQSWTDKRDLNVTCHIDDGLRRFKRKFVGGAQERDPNDPQYMQLAIESMNKYLQSSGNSAPHKVVRILRVTFQSVAGYLTTIYFDVKPEQPMGYILSCVSKLWEQSWTDKRDLDVNCKIIR